jgi:hypothetical protein
MKALKIEGCTVVPVDIENTLEALQAAVDGYIETVKLVPGRAVMIVNEEGLLRGMPHNITASLAAGTQIVGPAIVIGVDGEEFTDVPADIAQCIRVMFA